MSDLPEYSYVGVENLIKDKGGVSFSRTVQNIDSAIEVLENDVLIGNIRPYLRKIWLSDRNVGASGDVVVIRINPDYVDKLSPTYLYAVLSSDSFFDYDNANTKGAKMPRGDRKVIANYVIPIPPLSEQSRIVSELDLLQSIIDKQQAQLKELDNLAQAVFYDMFGDPVENEKGWEIKRLEKIGKVITGNTPSTKDEENYSSNDYCFVKPSDIAKEGVSIIDSTEFHISTKAYNQSRQLPKGSVLTTCIGIIGKVGILKQSATCNQQINAIIPSDIVEPYYLAYTMIGIRSLLEAMANAPVVPIINKGDFSKVEIPVPPLSLQQSFAEKIESIEKQKAAISQSIEETQKLFDYTMDNYFG